MGILYGSLIMRKLKFRITLLFATLNLWLNQIGDILLSYLRKGIDVKNASEDIYLGVKNYVTESWIWGKMFGNSTEYSSSFDPYLILYYILIFVSIFFWVQMAYAFLFAIADYYNQHEANRKRGKKLIYMIILLINIGVYIYLNSEIYSVF